MPHGYQRGVAFRLMSLEELTWSRARVRCAACRMVLGELGSTDGGETVDVFAAWASEATPKRARPHVAQERFEQGPLGAATVTWEHDCRSLRGRRRVRISKRLDKLSFAYRNSVRSGVDVFVDP